MISRVKAANMEVVEINAKKQTLPFCRRIEDCPCNTQCTRKYVQPERVKSFAPEKVYNPPSDRLEANTTYHLSYLNLDHRDTYHSRSRPIRPKPALDKSDGKFVDETTTKLSYRPVWSVIKAKPILPKHRAMTGTGLMESVTTSRRDYAKKYIKRPDIIVPCGNIRTSTGQLDGNTTAKLSYVNPGVPEMTVNYKPVRKYCPPMQPIVDDTTQKLSYQPFCVQEREFYAWQRKPAYKPPDTAMCGKTTYGESYLKNEEPTMEKAIRPSGTDILPYGAEFTGRTIYKESYLQCDTERVTPVIPCNSIFMSDGKMAMDTTSKLSYRPVRATKRTPFLPRYKSMIGDGPMQSETTNRHDFIPKASCRPELVVPCNNLRSADAPIDDSTTAKLSYVKPESVEQVRSFKPAVSYRKSADKLDSETVSKLSYQPWSPVPKGEVPWASKSKYRPPTDPMCADTIYLVSYPPPGHYEDICLPAKCDCTVDSDVHQTVSINTPN